MYSIYVYEVSAMAEKKRKKFSDKEKAFIFVRDSATCAFSGKNLWLLDQSIINWAFDAVDHVTLLSKGKEADVTNGALVSSTYNYMLSSHGRKYYVLLDGFPTNL